jgi:hypothetical protein
MPGAARKKLIAARKKLLQSRKKSR